MEAENIIVCRCEGITLKEIKDSIHILGLRDIEEIKRIYRCGMGACQGRTCQRLIGQILREEIKDHNVLNDKFTCRPPLVPVNFEEIAEVITDELT